MTKESKKDISFVEGSVFGSLIRFAVPVLGALILQAAYGAVDLLVVGWFGNANLPFLFVGIACVVNIIGDLLFVGVFKMDVAGAALATVLAQFMSVVISIIVLSKQKLPISFSRKQCRITPAELRKILNVGVPIALQETMVQISFLVINSIINDMGLMESAGYGVAQKIISFIMLVPSSVMQSVSAFVAQNIGAGKMNRAKKGFFTAMITGCSVGVIIFLIGFLGGAQISSLFTKDAEVIAQSAAYLKGFSVESILTCILFSSIGYFNGCGKSIPVMIQGISSAFCIRIPVSILMSRLSGASLMFVGLATPITTIYGIIFFLICFMLLKKIRRM